MNKVDAFFPTSNDPKAVISRLGKQFENGATITLTSFEIGIFDQISRKVLARS